MNEFVEIPANTISVSGRKRVYVKGINDVDYQTNPTVNGRQVVCLFYIKWKNMLKRCYDDKTQARQPAYIGATVCEEWLTFSVFKAWMSKQSWEGMELDKDIITPNNKMYSPETCCFVPQTLNTLLTDNGAVRGDYPQGVSFDKSKGKYVARCRRSGKSKFLGRFNTPEAASLAYRKYKANLVSEIAFEQTDERIEHGLMLHAALILKGE